MAQCVLCPATLNAQEAAGESHSLLLDAPKPGVGGYFPLGFVHGLPERITPLGFNFQQGLSTASSALLAGNPLSAPSVGADDPYSLRYNMRNLSMARPQEALAGLLRNAVARNQLPLKTQGYGELAVAYGADGRPRAAANIFDPPTRRYLLDYVRAHVKTRLGNAALGKTIALWGLDNEWEGQLDFSPQARAAFAEWLEKTYGNDVARLNQAWGTRFAGFDAATTGKLPDSDEYRAHPAQFLDWSEFQTEAFVALLADMARAMHDADPLKRGVIHKSTQQTIEMPAVNRRKTFDHERFARLVKPASDGWLATDAYGAGDRQLYEVNYLANCLEAADGENGIFLAETNNHSGPGHQFASTFWRLLASDVKGYDFFTLGFAGAAHDWKSFGFTDADTGKPHDKLFYAARLANMVHRSERFWTQSHPWRNAPRVALLMPRRDVLLADRDPSGSQWAYPENNRWMVYRWLREQGYWVDVVPYSTLSREALAAYKALFLVGAEHLSARESEAVTGYVRDGGVLVADTRAGYRDERHRVANRLEPLLSVRYGDEKAGALKIELDGVDFLAKGVMAVTTHGAQLVAEPAGAPPAYLSQAGKGRVLYFPFRLGSLALDKAAPVPPPAQVEGPTADSGERASVSSEFLIGRWLQTLLQRAALSPSYRMAGIEADAAAVVRIERPMVDERGNCAVIVANRAGTTQEIVPPLIVELTLPAGTGVRGLWAGAEDDELREVEVEAVGTAFRLHLPEVRTAGVLYLFKDSPPLLGISKIASPTRAADGATAQVKPGQTFTLAAQVFNVSGRDLPAGELRAQAPAGWQVRPASRPTPSLGAGQRGSYAFEVTVPAEAASLTPNAIYPLLVRWHDGQTARSTIAANVEVVPQAPGFLHILSDNAGYPPTYPYLTRTGATYRYGNESGVGDPAREKTSEGKALLNGYSNGRIGMRYSGLSGTEYFARFDSPGATILFDLQGQREVRQVVVVPGPGQVFPDRLKVSASSDGSDYRLVAEMPLDGSRQEIRTPPFSAQARYVRLEIAWPQAGGTLDEVEILGR